MAKLKITLTRSPIGNKHTLRRTVRALGLRKLHHSVIHEDNPTIRGMIAKVVHLVQVEPWEEAVAPAPQEEPQQEAKKSRATARRASASSEESAPETASAEQANAPTEIETATEARPQEVSS